MRGARSGHDGIIRGVISDFFIGCQNNFIAKLILQRPSFKGFNRFEHDANPALHIRQAGAIPFPAAKVGDFGESPFWKDRVIMACEDNLVRRVGAGGSAQHGTRLKTFNLTRSFNTINRSCFEQFHNGVGFRESLRQHGRECFQPFGIITARIDFRPADGAREHGVLALRQNVQRSLVYLG